MRIGLGPKEEMEQREMTIKVISGEIRILVNFIPLSSYWIMKSDSINEVCDFQQVHI